MATKYYKTISSDDPRIVVLEFKKNFPMALMFMRLQEYTEGIKAMRGNILSEGDSLLAYYKKRKEIWYKSGWAGFNLRGDTLSKIYRNVSEFETTLWNNLEEQLWGIFYKLYHEHGQNCYIVSYIKGDKTTLRHELHHAKYYLNREYREAVDKLLSKRKHKKARKYLEKLGYSLSGKGGKYIFRDEIQAYHSEKHKPTTKALGLTKEEQKKLLKLSKQYL